MNRRAKFVLCAYGNHTFSVLSRTIVCQSSMSFRSRLHEFVKRIWLSRPLYPFLWADA